MANELAIGLVIGASMRGVQTAFGSTQRLVTRLGDGIRRTTETQRGLERAMRYGETAGLRGLNTMRQRYDQLSRAIQSAERSQARLNSALERQERLGQQRSQLRGKMMETGAHAMAFAMPIKNSVQTFMEQEESANNLKIAMMKADGTFGEFNELSKIASDLGRDLPGTRKDFFDLAKALKMQGVTDKTLLNGGLKTSAKLNVLLDMDQMAGGEFFAKLMEGHGLSEAELDTVADDLQRAMFAGGMNKEQMYGAMAYYASNVRSMKLTGRENTQKIFAIEGLAAQQGMEGTSFGTGFSTMLDRMNKGPKMLAEAKKGMKAEAQDILNQSGVQFDFWDKKGNFKGINAMMKELEKLDKVRQKFGDEGAGLVAEGLFGTEGKRLALLLAEKGQKGLDEFIQKMREQANLEDRITQKTSTLSSALESLGGVWESAVGTFGSAFAQDIKAFANEAQNFIESTLTPWIERNKGLIKTTVGIIGGFIAFKGAILGLGYAANLIISPFISAWSVFSRFNALLSMARLGIFSRHLSRVGANIRWVTNGTMRLGRMFSSGVWSSLKTAGSALSWVAKGGLGLARVLGGSLVKGLMVAGKAVLWLGRALMMNPIGLIITAIAAAAFLIYTYWEPIKGFFSRLWNTVSSLFSQAWSGITNLMTNVWTEIKTAFDGGIAGIGALILNWSPLGLFYKAFAGVLSWFGVDLPNSFTGFGSMLIDGLVNGITNAWNAAKEKVSQLGEGIKNWFKEKLGIHSPSRVFAGYGVNIVEGLAQGVENQQGQASSAVTSMAQSAIDAVPKTINAPTFVVSEMGKLATEMSNKAQAISQAMPTSAHLAVKTEPKVAHKARSKTVANLAPRNTALAPVVRTSVQPSIQPQTQPSIQSQPEAKAQPQSFFGKLWDGVKNMGARIGDWFSELDFVKNLKFGAQMLGNSLANMNLDTIFQSPEMNPRTPDFNPNANAQVEPYQSLQQTFRERQQSQLNQVQNGIHITFNPTIQVNGNQGKNDIVSQVQSGLKMSLTEFEQLLNRVLDQRQRRAY